MGGKRTSVSRDLSRMHRAARRRTGRLDLERRAVGLAEVDDEGEADAGALMASPGHRNPIESTDDVGKVRLRDADTSLEQSRLVSARKG